MGRTLAFQQVFDLSSEKEESAPAHAALAEGMSCLAYRPFWLLNTTEPPDIDAFNN
jgi:hypothetical protein